MFKFMSCQKIYLICFLCFLGFLALALSAKKGVVDDVLPSIDERTKGMVPFKGYFNLYWDNASGSLFGEFDKSGVEFLYQVSLATGSGSNSISIGSGSIGKNTSSRF